jgi:hypothetical protein
MNARYDDPGPNLDFLPDRRSLEAQARRQLAELQRDGPIVDDGVGADSTNSIWMTVDPDGTIESIEISRRWKDQLDSNHVRGRCVRGVPQLPSRKRLLAGAARDCRRWTEPPPEPPPPEELEERPDPETWARRNEDRLERITSAVDADIRRVRGEDVADHETVLKSPEEFFTLRLRGRVIVELTADIMKVRRADAEQLRLEALDLFKAAGLTRTR